MSMPLAVRVRARAEEIGVTALVKKSKVSRSQVFAIMRGESSGRGETLKRLAKAGVDLTGIFEV